jgi:hypothetical protein
MQYSANEPAEDTEDAVNRIAQYEEQCDGRKTRAVVHGGCRTGSRVCPGSQPPRRSRSGPGPGCSSCAPLCLPASPLWASAPARRAIAPTQRHPF